MMLPYPISTNKMWRNFRGRMVLSAEGNAYKVTVAWLAKTHKVKVLDGDVAITVILYPRRNKDGTASKSRLDIDNVLKCALDSLNGIAYTDDKQVVMLHATIGEPVPDGGLSVLVEKHIPLQNKCEIV